MRITERGHADYVQRVAIRLLLQGKLYGPHGFAAQRTAAESFSFFAYGRARWYAGAVEVAILLEKRPQVTLIPRRSPVPLRVKARRQKAPRDRWKSFKRVSTFAPDRTAFGAAMTFVAHHNEKELSELLRR